MFEIFLHRYVYPSRHSSLVYIISLAPSSTMQYQTFNIVRHISCASMFVCLFFLLQFSAGMFRMEMYAKTLLMNCNGPSLYPFLSLCSYFSYIIIIIIIFLGWQHCMSSNLWHFFVRVRKCLVRAKEHLYIYIYIASK